jgi:predicted negative regulator of RcsB-dependent stress response
LEVYNTEEEQVEAIKKWWSENGKSIIAGIIIGITTIFGWRSYENHAAMQAQAASALYEQLLSASRKNDTDNMRVFANNIIADYESSTYAIFSKLMLAKLESELSNLKNAESYLYSILDNNSHDEFKHIARLRLIRVLIANNKLESAEELLTNVKPNQFIAHYEELRGDIFVKQGKIKEAAKAYQNALTNTISTEDTQSILQMKLDNLGRI